MGSVHSINSQKEGIERFFTFMYGEEVGFVYSPTKDDKTGDFEQYFFEWPTEKVELLAHVAEHTKTREVYYGPALFSNADGRAEESDVKGTHVVWCEFDGTLPKDTDMDNVPSPALKLQSSTTGHEHWYWRLDHFETNLERVKEVNKKLAYKLGADFCWNVNRVLRPVGTKHHESNRKVSVIRWDERPVGIDAFGDLPTLPINPVLLEDIRAIPEITDVILQYSFPPEAIRLFRDKVEKGHRNNAMTKMAHFCVEMGMKTPEILAVLYNVDSRWKKFSNRKDSSRRERLLAIINHVLAKHPTKEKKKVGIKVFSYNDFLEEKVEFNWLVNDLLNEAGLFCIAGPPQVGKSQVSLRLLEKMAKGEKWLKWQPTRPLRSIFMSLEMHHAELLKFFNTMQFEDTDGLLRENLFIAPVGGGLHLASTAVQGEINTIIEEFQPDCIVFDSYGRAVGDDLNSEKILFKTFEYIDNVVRGHYNVLTGFIHHNRKGQIGNKKPNKLDDLYGSQYFGASVGTALGLWPMPNEIEVNCLKLRLAENFKPFKMRRLPNLDFQVVEGSRSIDDVAILDGTGLAGSI